MRTFPLIAVATVFALSLSLSAKQPNVIVVMTDDQGYGELSVHGNPVLKTPNLDRLHAQSIRLVDFHVAPMCTPTRGQLLSGRDAARNGAINVSSGRTLLRAELPTMADLFAAAGYQTGMFGKWHLGDNHPYRPQDRGFQETVWFPSSHINSTPDVWDNDYFDDTFRHNGRAERYQGYCTDVFFRESIAWMRKQAKAGKRFFCYLPTNAPHWPHFVPQRFRDELTKEFTAAERAGRVPKLPAGKRAELISYLAMIRNADENMGRLDAFLKEAGVIDDTILVFLTDNGSTFAPDYFPAGMRGKKTQLWEGGHRVPCFVRWPNGGFTGQRNVGGLTEVQDLLPTLLGLSGIRSETAFDGIDLTPTLRGEAAVADDRMLVVNYSRMPFGFDYAAPDAPSIMRRDGAGVLWQRWRLLEDRELYDLRTDPMQRTNVIGSHPEVAAKMRAHLDRWWSEVKDAANEAQPVTIGHAADNPTMLTACEWLDVFIDQQVQVRRGELKNGWWELDVAEEGQYEFELRRWPREVDLPLRAAMPATKVTDGQYVAGEELPIASARIQLGGRPGQTKRLAADAKHATFTTWLPKGRTRLYTWFFDDRRQSLLGAYYVYVKRR